jgi:hypothetical protein
LKGAGGKLLPLGVCADVMPSTDAARPEGVHGHFDEREAARLTSISVSGWYLQEMADPGVRRMPLGFSRLRNCAVSWKAIVRDEWF